MAGRPHRKATLKQLVKLSEEYWSAPRELTEILSELRLRDESDAQPVIRSIVRRLSVLNYKPSVSTAEPGAGSAREQAADAQRRRRRLLLAALPPAAAAAVAAWLLWPRREPPPSPAESTVGLDLTAHSVRLVRRQRNIPERGDAIEELRRPATVAVQRSEPPPKPHDHPRGLELTAAPSPPLHGSTASIFVALPSPTPAPTADLDLIENLGPNILEGRVRRSVRGRGQDPRAASADADQRGRHLRPGEGRMHCRGHRRAGLRPRVRR